MSAHLHDPILLIEDDPTAAFITEQYLRQAGYQVRLLDSRAAALNELSQTCPAAIVLDWHLPDGQGLEILQVAHRHYPDLPIIVVTGDTTAATAQQAIAAGAHDFILKPFSGTRLTVTLSHALNHYAQVRELKEWRQTLIGSQYHGFIGQSPPMQAVYRIIESVAASRASVFITGESGTGKELAAQALHQASPRREQPYVAINCAAIPDTLLESHLFGHVKGAFTGAMQDHAGALAGADGGTLMLDEIGEMPPPLQAKMLRFLQSGEFTPVGSDKIRKVDVRVVAATNREPLAEVKAGRFREDLYYRLHVVPLELPPLREREDDVILLAQHFLQQANQEEQRNFTAFAPDVIKFFRAYEWPGNVRQLEHLIRSLVLLNEGDCITAAMLPRELTSLPDVPRQGISLVPVGFPTPIKPLWQIERDAIEAALETTGQDVVKAAALLEVSPSTLYRKLQQWKNPPHTAA